MVENAMEAEKDLKPASYVYVARAWSTACQYHIKVGRSIDPDKRLETLQKDISGRSRNPHKYPEAIYDIELIAIWAGGKETERLLRHLLDTEFVHPDNKKWAYGEYLLLSAPSKSHSKCDKDLDDPYDQCEVNSLLHDDLVDYLLCLGFETPEMLKMLGVIWHRENNHLLPENLRKTADYMDSIPSNSFELISKGNS
jgi:hypothetical protein